MHLSATMTAVAAGVLFLLMLMGAEAGRRLGLKYKERDPDGSHKGIGAVEGAVFGLLGLLIALTFTGAASRFDARRQLIVEETTAITGAYRKLDLLSLEDQAPLRARFRAYVDMRAELFNQARPNFKEYAEKEAEAQTEIWALAREAASKEECENTGNLVLTGISDMFDITSRRRTSARMHVPEVILVLLFSLAAFSSILAGYAMATSHVRKTLHNIAFAAILSVTIFVILDLEYPRSGIIRLDKMDTSMSKTKERLDKEDEAKERVEAAK